MVDLVLTVLYSIELAKEQLFPTTHTAFNSFSTAQSSFRSTIFGPLSVGVYLVVMCYAKNPTDTKASQQTMCRLLKTSQGFV